MKRDGILKDGDASTRKKQWHSAIIHRWAEFITAPCGMHKVHSVSPYKRKLWLFDKRVARL